MLTTELVKAVVANLKNNTDLAAIHGGRVYERAPDPTKLIFPFVQIGEFVSQRSNDDCYVTYDLSVVSFSDEPSIAELATISDLVVCSLDTLQLGVANAIQFSDGSPFKQLHFPPSSQQEDFRISVAQFSYAFVNQNMFGA